MGLVIIVAVALDRGNYLENAESIPCPRHDVKHYYSVTNFGDAEADFRLCLNTTTPSRGIFPFIFTSPLDS